MASIEEMAGAAREMGMAYIGLCDHSRSAAYAGGLEVERVLLQHAEVDRLNAGYGGSFRILKGIEADILPDGSLDYPDDVLASFELVIGSVHSRFGLSGEEQTARVLRALENPYLDMLGHPTGRLLLSRDAYAIDLHRILDAAAERGVAVEINAHPQRLDLDWPSLRYGLPRGMKTSVNPDAHDAAGLSDIVYGVGIARKGWCTVDDVLDAWAVDKLLAHLRARRRDAGAGRKPVAISSRPGPERPPGGQRATVHKPSGGGKRGSRDRKA